MTDYNQPRFLGDGDARQPSALEWRPPLRSLDELEQDVARVAQSKPIDDLGRMSAEAVRAQYDATAEAFQIMGREVTDLIDKLHAALQLADKSMKLLAGASTAIREQGKLAHVQIERMSAVAKEIQDLHDEVLKKVTG